MECHLPYFFDVKNCGELIRLGRSHDGGYLVNERDVINSNHLISFGICDDWSFEKNFYRLNNAGVSTYDASTSYKLFFSQLKDSIKRKNIEDIVRSLASMADFPAFFVGKKKHYRYFVSSCKSNDTLGVDDVFDNLPNDHIFLKIDIEGDEYKILDSLIKYQDRVTGMVIEFHDIPNHLREIEDFLDRFKPKIVHLHPNNFGQVDKTGVPTVVEITFSSHFSDDGQTANFPHELDMPNNKSAPELTLKIQS